MAGGVIARGACPPFMMVILGITTKAAVKAKAAIGIGLMFTRIHLDHILIANTS